MSKISDLPSAACQYCGKPLNLERGEVIICEGCRKLDQTLDEVLMIFRAVPYIRVMREERMRKALEKLENRGEKA